MALPIKRLSQQSDDQDFSNLVETLSCPVGVFDEEEPVYANEAWLSLMDMRFEQFVRVKNIHELISWQNVDRPATAHTKIHSLNSNADKSADQDIGPNTDQRVKLRLNARPDECFDAVHQSVHWQGRVVSLLVVTTNRPMPLDTATDQQRLLDISRTSADWFWELDSDLRYSWFSDNIETITGRPPQWFYGRKFSNYLAPSEKDQRNWNTYIEKMNRHEVVEDFVFQIVRKDGEKRWVRISGAPFYSSDGHFCGYRGTGSDINDTKLTTIALRNSEQRLRQFAETASDWYWEMDKELRFTFLTENVFEATGLPVEFFIGKTRLEIFGDDLFDDPVWVEHYKLLSRHEPFKDFVYSAASQDRTNSDWLRVNGSPIFSADGEFDGYRGCATVITDQVRDQTAREVSERRFREFSELAADWFWETDADLKIIYVSDRFLEICGVEPSRMIGMSVCDVESGYSEFRVENEVGANSITELMEKRQPFAGWQFDWRRPEGRVVRTAVNARPIYDSNNNFIGYRGIATDITQKYQLSQELEFQANHDALTGLYNRREFDRFAQIALDKAKQNQESSALLYIDLDQFKLVNDSVGHLAGDELIKHVSSLIASQVGGEDIVARLGGDEFGVLLNDCADKHAMKVAGLIAEIVREFTFSWDGQAFRISASIGVVSIDESTESLTDVLSRADVACYAAKDAGRNRISRYEEYDEGAIRQHNQILQAAGIRDSLQNDRFRLYKQVILPISSLNEPPRFELLLRLLDSSENVISPGAVIPAAERFDLMPAIDRWVLKTALESLAYLRSLHPGCVISVNISGTTISDASLPEYVESLLARYSVEAGAVCFEVTETALISNIGTASSTINSIKSMGHSFALDDFGSGMSSFAYLKHLPVDYLKIDGSFVRDMHIDKTDYAVVAAINEIAHRLGIKTIAEFVESEAIIEKLAKVGVDYGQGYALGKPVPLDEVSEVIEENSLTHVGGFSQQFA